MKKRKDEILVNYEGEPFYNLNTDEWLIDFEPRLKQELLQIIKYGDDGCLACRLLAVRNMTYSAALGFKETECVNPSYFRFISYTNDKWEILPCWKEDIQFLYYRLGQLMTKHENVSLSDKHRIIKCATNFMVHGGIDVIEELGDVFNYEPFILENKWNSFWESGQTSYHKICDVFKTEFMRKVTYKIIQRVRWLDDCV